MRVSAGVREDKDPADSLPACATCISLRRSRCAQIRAESVAARTAARFSRRGTKRFWWRMAADGCERGPEGSRRLAGGWKKWRWGPEWRRWYGGELAMNDRNQRNTAPRKLPPSSFRIHPEYIIHTGVPRRGASSSLGQGVAHSGTDMAPEEEKRAREEPHDRPCSTVLHHEKRLASYDCIYRLHYRIFLLVVRFRLNVIIRFVLSHVINFSFRFTQNIF